MSALWPCNDNEFEKMRDLQVPWKLLMLQSAAQILAQEPPDTRDSEHLS